MKFKGEPTMEGQQQTAQEIFDGQVVAKFRVDRHDVTTFSGSISQTTVVMSAQQDDGIAENARFAKSTPFAELRMAVDNPLSLIRLQPGREFIVVFSPCSPKPVGGVRTLAPNEVAIPLDHEGR